MLRLQNQVGAGIIPKKVQVHFIKKDSISQLGAHWTYSAYWAVDRQTDRPD